jgi:hypothetical protein
VPNSRKDGLPDSNCPPQGFSSVVLKTPHKFADEYWKTILFQRPKTQLDNLVDVVLSIPEYILLADSMIYMTSTFDLQESLQKLWVGLSALISNLDNQVQNDEELLARTHNTSTPALLTDDCIAKQLSYSQLDPFKGCLAAIRHAAYLICFSLLASTDTASTDNQDKAFHHSEAALNAVGDVDTSQKSPASSLFLTTVFALNVVSVWSPSPTHQEYSLRKLEGKFH